MAMIPDDSVAFEGDLALPPPYSRSVMDQDEFDKKYVYRRPHHDHGKTVRHLKKFTKRYWKPFTSPQLFFKTLVSFVPILTWLPAYDWKANIIGDFLGGITLSVINIPQGW
uniref:SLC26A/SulP transporter domain-containing protein n=1 Tax=Panagrolaimus sp. JU765 TaxID=591449 RepID=A0AC34RBE9_9BILA